MRSAAPLAVMAVIFWLSAQPDFDPGVSAPMLVARKLAHVTEYAVLTALWAWALAPLLRWPALALAAGGISLAYAISDEYHQTFVTGRTGQAVDVLIDCVGIALALWLIARYARGSASTPRIHPQRRG